MTRKPSYEELERRIQMLAAEQKLHRKWLSSIVENSVVGFYRSTPSGKFKWVNAAFATMLGYDTPEALVEGISNIGKQLFLHKSDRDRFMEILRQKGRIENFEHELIRRGGQNVWISETAQSCHDENGGIIGYEGMAIEVTRQRASELAKEDTEKFIFSLLNSLPLPVFYKNRAGRYQGVNKAFESFFGMKREKIVGKSVFDVNPAELAQIYFEMDEELFDSGAAQRYESQVKNAHGSVRDVIFDKSVYMDRKGKTAGLIGTVLDITDRKMFERALQESEARFRVVFDEAYDGILVVNSKTKTVVMANGQICRMLGYTREELFELSIYDILPENIKTEIEKNFEEHVGQGQKIAETIPVQRKDGTIFYADVSASSICSGGERMRVGIFRDITERWQMENEREELINELQAALAEIKTLRGIVPICSKCKKIRDDKGYWNILESFIQEHSEASFSHSLCPQCSEELYGNEDWYKKMKKETD